MRTARNTILAFLAFLPLACRGPVLDSTRDTPTLVQGALDRLNDAVPLTRPVELREVPLLERGLLGQSRRYGDEYLILLDDSLPDREQYMVLIHEWAHLVVWDRGERDTDEHGPYWGRDYAEAYRALLK